MTTEIARSVETITHKTNVEQQSLDYLISQFRDQAVVEAIVKAVASEVQEIEDALFSVLDGRRLRVAEGVQLDNIGQEVGVQRRGSTDDQYRVLLGIREEVRQGAGTYGEVYDKLVRVTGDVNTRIISFPQRRVDVLLTARCLGASPSYTDLANLFPVNTNTSILVKGELSSFGFSGNTNAAGFRSISQTSDPLSGHLVSLVYSKEQELRSL